MKSALRIMSQQARILNNIKSKTHEKTTQKVPKHMRLFPNFKFGKSAIIHYEKRIKNDVDLDKLNKANMNLPVYKYRVDPKIERIK